MIHTDHPKFIISIILSWLFAITTIIGFFLGYEQGFTVMLPMNIAIYLVFIIWNSHWKQLVLLLIPFGIGFSIRILTVQYDWILGSYSYGETMSYKVGGVPVTVGLSWIIFAYSTGTIAQGITPKLIPSTLIATLLSFGLHILFSLSSSKLDLWEFENGSIPLRYYIIMFCIIAITQFLFQAKAKLQNRQLALHMFLTMLTFAISFLLL